MRGGTGAALIGGGISYVTSVSIMRFQGAEFWQWFLEGTLALVILVAGNCLLIDAVRFRIKMDQ